MSNLDEKQIKRLRNLIKEAEMNLLAAKELLISLVGDGEELSHNAPRQEPADGETVVEGVFDGQNMIGHNSKISQTKVAEHFIRHQRCRTVRFRHFTHTFPAIFFSSKN